MFRQLDYRIRVSAYEVQITHTSAALYTLLLTRLSCRSAFRLPTYRKLPRFVRYVLGITVALRLLANVSYPLGMGQVSAPSQQKADIIYRQAMVLLRRKQYQVALEKFRELESYAPSLPQGYTGEGIALALSGRPKDAVALFQKALVIDPSFWVARRELGIIEWQLNRKDEAARNLTVIHKLFPEDPPVNVILGEYNFAEKNYELASEYFAKVPAQVAASLRLSLMASEALLKTGRLKEAAANLEALSFTPNLTPEERFKIAWMLGEATDYSRAIHLFNSLPPTFPDQFRRGYGLALAYYNEGRYNECIETLTALKRMGTVRAELFSLLGAAEERKGDTVRAYNTFREGIRRFPHDDEDYLNIATVAVKHLSYQLAIQILDIGVAAIPNDYKLLFTRGVVNTLRGNLRRAREDYEKALSLAPAQSSVYVGLAICLMDQDNYDAAAGILRKAIQRGVKDETIYYFLADALYRGGLTASSPQYDEAMSAVQASLRLDPAFAYGYLERGRLELLGGKTRKAVEDFDLAMRLLPSSQTVLYELATAYRLEGRKVEAERLFARVSQSSQQEDRQFRRRKLVQILSIVPEGSEPIR